MSTPRRQRHPMPDDIEQVLGERGLTNAYRARPPYQRNDYLGWIAHAKREDTRQRRIAQMLEELVAGDVYMRMDWRPSRAGAPGGTGSPAAARTARANADADAPRPPAPRPPARLKPRLDDLELVAPAGRAEWRAWLEANHATSSGIWLAVGKKGNTVTTLTYDGAVEEALCFGWIDSTVRAMDEARFRQLFTPRKPGGTWARTNKARVQRLLTAGLMRPVGLAAVEAAKADGSWTLLDEVEALLVPEDLAAALQAHPAAERGFGALPDSQKKQVLYWVRSAKRQTTRAQRIVETVTAAAERRLPR